MHEMYEVYASLRDARGLTDYQVCKATGIPTSSMSCWKTGKSSPKIEKLVKIARMLGVTVDDLLTPEMRGGH